LALVVAGSERAVDSATTPDATPVVTAAVRSDEPGSAATIGSCVDGVERLASETAKAPKATPPKAAATAMAIGRFRQRSAKPSSDKTNRSAADMAALIVAF
jgi:hypothetical protein